MFDRLARFGVRQVILGPAADALCIRIVTGTGSSADGTLDLYVNGTNVLPGGSDGAVHSRGETVVDSCSFMLGSTVEIQSPTNNAWAGSISVSTDRGGTFRPMACLSCTGGSSTAAIVVDGNSNGANMATTACLDGDRCALVDGTPLLPTDSSHCHGCSRLPVFSLTAANCLWWI